MKTIEYQIEAITNLHVGSGEANFGVVDKLVQIDAATGFPNVNASGIKGALRELLKPLLTPEQVTDIFGSEPDETKNHKVGSFRFFDAYLLAMPVRSNKAPFLMGTCPRLIRDYLRFNTLFGRLQPLSPEMESLQQQQKRIERLLELVKNKRPLVSDEVHRGAFVEDFEEKALYVGDIENKPFDKQVIQEAVDCLKRGLGGSLALFTDEDFRRLCDEDHLPVIARNNLMKGNENLWYEQVVPRFSHLYCFIGVPDDTTLEKAFNEALSKAGLVQLGANATVGYGYCEFTKIKKPFNQ